MGLLLLPHVKKIFNQHYRGVNEQMGLGLPRMFTAASDLEAQLAEIAGDAALNCALHVGDC